MKDVLNATAQVLVNGTSRGITLKTTSRDKQFLTGDIIDADICVGDEGLDSHKVFDIASITKTFTAAAVVKVATDERYKDQFADADDPLNTSIAHFEVLIGQDDRDNVRQYFHALKDNHPRYHDITLRHLLNHSSGILDDTWELAEKAQRRADPTQLAHIEDCYVSPHIDPDKFGHHSYSNPTYDNVLRPILEAVTGRRFSDIVTEEIIDPLGLTQTFTYDRASDLEKTRSDLQVVRGLDYYQGVLHQTQDYNVDSASGGMTSSAADVRKFYGALVSGALLNEKGHELFFAEENYVLDPKGIQYGLGIQRQEYGSSEIFGHGGACMGGYSHVFAQRAPDGEVTTAATVLAYENLTRPIAEALIGEEIRNEAGDYSMNETLQSKMHKLSAVYNEEELLEMRSWLERSTDKPFEERSQNFQEIYESRCLYDKGINPTTPEFASYINKSDDWANMSEEIDYFLQFQDSPFRHERVDAKGYITTCMFKILDVVNRFDNNIPDARTGELITEDPRDKISPSLQEFLVGNRELSVENLRARVVAYGQDVIDTHGHEHDAAALSSIASVYGVRATMVHNKLLRDEDIATEIEPRKFLDGLSSDMSPHLRQNIALALETFEESAELGNVRSMGSMKTWAEQADHADKKAIRQKWVLRSATSTPPNPVSMVAYGDMVMEGAITQDTKSLAITLYQNAAEFGLQKAEKRLQDIESLSMMAEDSWARRIRDAEKNQSNQHVR